VRRPVDASGTLSRHPVQVTTFPTRFASSGDCLLKFWYRRQCRCRVQDALGFTDPPRFISTQHGLAFDNGNRAPRRHSCAKLAADPASLSCTKPRSQPDRDLGNGRPVRAAVGGCVGMPALELRAEPRHCRAGGRLSRAAVHLRLLAAQPRGASCKLGQPRGARHRRHRHADGGRVPGPLPLAPHRLSPLPQSAGDVRPGTRPICFSCSTGIRPVRRSGAGVPG
jgi:hypothetical protein